MFILTQLPRLRSGCLAFVLGGTCGEAEPQEGNARWSKAAALRQREENGGERGRREEGERRGKGGVKESGDQIHL